MASRIAPNPDAFPMTPAKSKPVKRPEYLKFIRRLPCIITLRPVVDAAHVSTAAPDFGAHGRGKGQKADCSWTLPLVREKHDEQHRIAEMTFWHKHGINPHTACLTLWGIYNRMEPDEAVKAATAIIRRRGLGRMQ